jgi:glycosyltransferase involved in cell wall biosynthesis
MRIAIVSSIDELCGNATFTNHLVENINKSGNIAVAEGLPLSFVQSLNPRIRKVADIKIREMAKRLSTYDAVNIQFEAGLYGSKHNDILNRLKLLLAANPNTSVTLHATRFFDNSVFSARRALKELAAFRIRTSVNTYARYRNNLKVTRNNRDYLTLIAKYNLRIIVHTLKAKEVILSIVDNPQVFVHPIKFTDPRKIPASKSFWAKKFELAQDDILVGLFGFISKYKGFESALNALHALPDNYKLVIAGRLHPQSIREHEIIDSYLKILLDKIEVLNLSERVFFLNELSDNELNELAATVDFAWLPYLETGQDGSGIASILFDLSPRLIASNCKAFDELIRIIPEYKCERFDIGNYLELANKTKHYQEYRKLDKILEYSNDTQTQLYLEVLSK